VQHLRTFGCTAFAKRTGPSVNKLADRSIPGVFLGYESGTKGLYDPVNKKLIVTRDVIFDEKRRWNWEEKAAGQSELAPQFSVVYADEVLDGTVHGPAIEPTQLSDQDLGAGVPSSPAAAIPSEGGCSGYATSHTNRVNCGINTTVSTADTMGDTTDRSFG